MPDTPPIPVMLLFGPTASGKTDILEELFAAPRAVFPAEIVSADSMQVYRGMDIGTAKPSDELRRRLPHHLIDILNLREQFSAGEFVRLADAACVDIAARGKLPLISGGTGFYMKNFVQGMPVTPPSDPEIRAALQDELSRGGIGPLAEELALADPVSASRIHPNDEYRLLRALEVFRSSGRPLSSFSRDGTAAANTGKQRPGYRFLIIGLRRPREELYRRINRRSAAMFREGLVAEVEALKAAGAGPDDPGMRAIGYREFFVPAGDGTMRISKDIAGVEELVARNSRRYAKRQITFFASIPGVIWVDAGAEAAGIIKEKLREFLAAS